MYFNHLFNVDEWNENAHYIIFDDFEFKYMPGRKAFIGAQREFTVTDKYRKKRTVKWGKPCIYLCNPDQDPFNDISLMDRDWYNANMFRVEITNKLY